MFDLLGEFTEPSFAMEDIVKIHRGMNQVNVSVGEHTSEPSEVYVVTVEESEESELSTFVVFFLEEPRIRIVYGFDDNPYGSDRRIHVESEAIEFVEEMGAIVEDIAWEGMNAQDRDDWIEQQPLYPSEEESFTDEVEDLSDEALILEIKEPEDVEPEESETESEEVEEEELAAGKDEGEPHEPVVEERAKTVIDESIDKVVLVEEKFDEMLEQAFLKKPGEASTARVEVEVENDVLMKAAVGDMPSENDQTAAPESKADDRLESPAPAGESGSVAPSEFDPAPSERDQETDDDSTEGELRRKVLRFLSKM